MKIKLTVLFENSFWIGLFEESCDGNYSVCKYIFGSEPKDNQIYEMILSEFYGLDFSNPNQEMISTSDVRKKINPKRMQRIIKKEMKDSGIGTKAQRAISAERELKKIQRKKTSKNRKAEIKKLQYVKKQEIKKQKKRGH